MSEVLIQPDTTYTLSADIGNDLTTAHTKFWSLQLWVDTNSNGSFGGSSEGNSFIGQQFGLSAAAI